MVEDQGAARQRREEAEREMQDLKRELEEKRQFEKKQQEMFQAAREKEEIDAKIAAYKAANQRHEY